MKRSLGAGEWVRRGVGVAVLAAVSAIALDTGFLTQVSLASTASLEQKLLTSTWRAIVSGSKARSDVSLPIDARRAPNVPLHDAELPRTRRTCQNKNVNLRLVLCRFLSICAIVGLVLAPLTAPASAVGMGTAPMGSAGPSVMQDVVAGASAVEMADGMPRCPPETPALPDCQKDCPLAALCLAKCFGGAVANSFAPIRVAREASLAVFDDAARDGLPQAPPPRPPRA